jgi:4'-phosphopantetheinyl transferase EntD
MFTAKEAFYKWQFQITRVLLDFHEVEVEPTENDRFEIVPVSARARAAFRHNAEGQWLHGDGLTVACVGHDQLRPVKRDRLTATEKALTC